MNLVLWFQHIHICRSYNDSDQNPYLLLRQCCYASFPAPTYKQSNELTDNLLDNLVLVSRQCPGADA